MAHRKALYRNSLSSTVDLTISNSLSAQDGETGFQGAHSATKSCETDCIGLIEKAIGAQVGGEERSCYQAELNKACDFKFWS